MLALSVLVLVAGCGGSDSEDASSTFTGVPVAAQDPGPIHVHGLGYDEERGVLFIATHTGLFELPDGGSKARRIGKSYQDTMGFTLVRPGLLLGSGHPDLRDESPPHLGLIRSTNGGRSWKPVSLSGQADFHVLRAAGRRVYGFDSRGERLLRSADGGRTWKRGASPEPFLDLAIDPRDPDRLIGSGRAVLYRSEDAGRTWKVSANGVAGLLAWPNGRQFFVVDPAGVVLVSKSGQLTARGDVGGEPAALLALDERTLFVALHDGTIKRSSDGGATWAVRSTP